MGSRGHTPDFSYTIPPRWVKLFIVGQCNPHKGEPLVSYMRNTNYRRVELQKPNLLSIMYSSYNISSSFTNSDVIDIILIPTVWPKCLASASSFNHSPIHTKWWHVFVSTASPEQYKMMIL